MNGYHLTILTLKKAYEKMPFYQKLFFPYKLASELKKYPDLSGEPTNEQTFSVFKAVENNTWFFQRWFFSSLQTYNQDNYTRAIRAINATHDLTKEELRNYFNFDEINKITFHVSPIIIHLSTKNLLTKDNLAAAVKLGDKNSEQIIAVLRNINDKNLLTQGNVTATLGHKNPIVLKKSIDYLDKYDLLNENCFNAVVDNNNPEGLAEVFNERDESEWRYLKDTINLLSTNNLLTQDNCTDVFNNKLQYYLHKSIKSLQEKKLLDQGYFHALAVHNLLYEIEEALSTLKNFKGDETAMRANVDDLLNHKHPGSLACLFQFMNETDLLTDDNRKIVVGLENPGVVSDVYSRLNKKNKALFTGNKKQDNFNAVIENIQSASSARWAILALGGSSLPASEDVKWQDTFDALFIKYPAILLHKNYTEDDIMGKPFVNIWSRLFRTCPGGYTTQEQFLTMCNIAEKYKSSPIDANMALREYVRRITTTEEDNAKYTKSLKNDTVIDLKKMESENQMLPNDLELMHQIYDKMIQEFGVIGLNQKEVIEIINSLKNDDRINAMPTQAILDPKPSSSQTEAIKIQSFFRSYLARCRADASTKQAVTEAVPGLITTHPTRP